MLGSHTQLDSPVTDPRIGRRLFGFVAASLLLHSIMMVSLPSEGENSVPFTPPMHISLVAPAPTVPATPEATIPTAKPPSPVYTAEKHSKPIQEPAPTEAPTVEATAPPQAVETTTIETQSLAVEQTVGELERNQIRQLLEEALAHQFYYPKQARKRGWQGEVVVAFTLNTHGGISNERIIQSSNYSMLDKAALKTLRRVNLNGVHIPQALEYELPIPFHLIGG
jgi:protein TonB